MPDVLFYERPVALNRDAHRTLKVKLGESDLSFARQTNSVPLAGIEFPFAALEYPIVFAGPSDEKLVPLAVVGLQQNQNLFVDANGKWTGLYVPAFIRRYPFVLAEQAGVADLAVCIDIAYPGLNNETGEALFDAEGKETTFLKNALNFLGEYQSRTKQTQDFIAKLRELKLLAPRVLQAKGPNNSSVVLQGFQAVDEAKLNALPDSEIIGLYRSGFLGWINAHLISLGNAQRLAAKMPLPVQA